MKKIILSLSILGIIAACGGVDPEKRKVDFAELIDAPTEMTFEESNYDFGQINEGEEVNKTFTFTNTGDNELVLISVNGSCGCTVPEKWPQHPILPGESGEIEVSFDSNGRSGNIHKTVRIEANTKPTVTVLTLTGVVNKK